MSEQFNSPYYEIDQSPGFRETEPIKLWSACIGLFLPYKNFETTVSSIARTNSQRYTGFITKDSEGNVTSFTRTRYPRRKYGVASIEECEAGMRALAATFNTATEPDPQTSGFRVVLGLKEGYDDEAPIHTLEEIKRELIGLNATPAEVFAVRWSDEGVSVYTEPVAIVEGTLNLVDRVYAAADTFKQERFTVENFDQGLAYVVETRFCTEPD